MSKIRLQWASACREYKKFVLTTLLFNTLFDFLYKFGSTSSSCQIGGCSYVYVRALGVCHASPCCFSTSWLFLPRSQDPASWHTYALDLSKWSAQESELLSSNT